MKAKKKELLTVSGVVWMIAGINILRIGITSYLGCLGGTRLWAVLLMLALSALIFFGFAMMFWRIVKKNEGRIMGYREEKQSIFRFFDLRGYLLMAFMMALGIGLRSSGLLPTSFFAVFYSGLGSGLTLAGVLFFIRRIAAGKREGKEGQ